MVSTLWKACSEGNLENVFQLLKDASSVDIEIKDHTGVTPLIEAVRNGHVDVVRALLDKGANPTNNSSQARPEQYTSDPAILDLLGFAQSKISATGMPPPPDSYDVHVDSERQYYPPPPGAYSYYPGMNPGAPPMREGAMYYPAPPPQPTGDHQQESGGPPNLPPPEVARFIPCRYFPACRYGSSCLFAHPQGPYLQGPLPQPAQYPTPYDPMVPQNYAPSYYAVPSPSFQPPNAVPSHMTPLSPQSSSHHAISPMLHARSVSEIVSPPGQFSPSTAPHPVPYGAIPPMSPTYPLPGPAPVPRTIPPLPPLHHQPPPPGPQSPQSLYNNNTSPSAAFTVHHQDAVSQYPPQNVNSHGNYPDVNSGPKSPPTHAQADGYSNGPVYREGVGHSRRGNARRSSFGGRKPSCLFFPSGRCKNGDDCRFPHVMPDGPGGHHPPHFSGRGGARTRGDQTNTKGFGIIEEKLGGMTLRDDASFRPQNGAEGSSRSHSTDPGNRARHSQGIKPNMANGTRIEKKATAKQRVPNADEFPVLAGSTTPPSRNPGLNGVLTNGNGHYGPTAAQVLQAPPPIRKDSTKEPSTRGVTPDPVRPVQSVKEPKPVEPNGITADVNHEQGQQNKLPVSFAAMATAVPDVVKEVSVSA